MALRIKHFPELTHSHSVAWRLGKVVRKILAPVIGIGNRTLHERPRNRIRPIQNYNFNSGLGGRFQKKSPWLLLGVQRRAPDAPSNHHSPPPTRAPHVLP